MVGFCERGSDEAAAQQRPRRWRRRWYGGLRGYGAAGGGRWQHGGGDGGGAAFTTANLQTGLSEPSLEGAAARRCHVTRPAEQLPTPTAQVARA